MLFKYIQANIGAFSVGALLASLPVLFRDNRFDTLAESGLDSRVITALRTTGYSQSADPTGVCLSLVTTEIESTLVNEKINLLLSSYNRAKESAGRNAFGLEQFNRAASIKIACQQYRYLFANVLETWAEGKTWAEVLEAREYIASVFNTVLGSEVDAYEKALDPTSVSKAKLYEFIKQNPGVTDVQRSISEALKAHFEPREARVLLAGTL